MDKIWDWLIHLPIPVLACTGAVLAIAIAWYLLSAPTDEEHDPSDHIY